MVFLSPICSFSVVPDRDRASLPSPWGFVGRDAIAGRLRGSSADRAGRDSPLPFPPCAGPVPSRLFPAVVFCLWRKGSHDTLSSRDRRPGARPLSCRSHNHRPAEGLLRDYCWIAGLLRDCVAAMPIPGRGSRGTGKRTGYRAVGRERGRGGRRDPRGCPGASGRRILSGMGGQGVVCQTMGSRRRHKKIR